MGQKHLIIVMGVSGCGKSTIAKYLSEQLSFKYLEADDYHSAANKAHMESGNPLTDEMRWPWIQHICQEIECHDGDIILANSGLKSAHRACFIALDRITNFIHLKASQETIQARLELRTDHFMPPELLSSQFRDMKHALDAEPIHCVDSSATLEAVKAAALDCAKNIINKTNRTIEETSCG